MDSSLYFKISISKYSNVALDCHDSLRRNGLQFETWSAIRRDRFVINREFCPLRVLTSANFYRECLLKWRTIVGTYQLSQAIAMPFRNRRCIVICDLYNFGECLHVPTPQGRKMYFHVLSNKSKRNWLFVNHNQIKLFIIRAWWLPNNYCSSRSLKVRVQYCAEQKILYYYCRINDTV